MKHVIALGLMTLQVGAQANLDESLAETVSKVQTMVAFDLNIPMHRVAELFKIVFEELGQFSSLPEEARDLISTMRTAKA